MTTGIGRGGKEQKGKRKQGGRKERKEGGEEVKEEAEEKFEYR